MNWIILLEKGLLGGVAALAFGILFNVPRRALIPVVSMGILGIFIKNFIIESAINTITASFAGAASIGVLGLIFSKSKNSPPLVFSIPSVIPMVPGIFIYKFMVGLIKLMSETGVQFNDLLYSTINNGLKAAFILMALAAGVSAPNLIFRRESFHDLSIVTGSGSKTDNRTETSNKK